MRLVYELVRNNVIMAVKIAVGLEDKRELLRVIVHSYEGLQSETSVPKFF